MLNSKFKRVGKTKQTKKQTEKEGRWSEKSKDIGSQKGNNKKEEKGLGNLQISKKQTYGILPILPFRL